MRRLLQRLVAVVIVLLVALGSSGAARAMDGDGMITCCCGPHSALRRCKCLHCPVGAKHADHGDEEHVASAPPCEGAAVASEAILIVQALPASALVLSPPDAVRLPPAPPPVRPVVRLDEPQRPPP